MAALERSETPDLTVAKLDRTPSLRKSTAPTKKSAEQNRNLKVLKALLPKVPLMAKVIVTHGLHMSEPARYLDLRSDLIISVIRSLLEPTTPRTVTSTQAFSVHDGGIKGKMWISKFTAPAPPESSIQDELLSLVDALRDPLMPSQMKRKPALIPVEAEWTGYREGVSSEEPELDISERAKFGKMMEEVTHPTTILYLHGGGFYLGDPATHRDTTKKLAKITGGRCYSVRYRLAPQHPFPSALLDALVSYMTLLYPPPGAYHEPVDPKHLVISGESAGGNLALSLVQTIMQFRKNGTKIRWYGEERELPLPASVACNSPWLDITQSAPAWQGQESHTWDYLPKPGVIYKYGIAPCEIWPASPPRRLLYVDDEMATHPLASLVMCDSWEGCPPVYMCTGWEILAYEDKYMAKKLAVDCGVPVVFEEYEAMPHCFAMILDHHSGSRRCYDGWAGFIRQSVDDPASIDASATYIKSRTLKEIPVTFEKLTDTTDDEIRTRVIDSCNGAPVTVHEYPSKL